MKPLISVLLLRLSRIDLRGILLVCGLLITIFSVRSDVISGIDFRLYQLSSFLQSSPKGTSDIAIIQVPAEEIKKWHDDVHSAGKLGALLSNILHASSSTVGIILERPLSLGKSQSDLLVEGLLEQSQKSTDTVVKARELIQRREFLLEFLRDERVVIGTTGDIPVGLKPIEVEAGVLEGWSDVILRWWWPTTYETLPPASKTSSRPLVDHYPVFRANRFHEHQLVVGNARTTLYPGFFSRYLLAAEKSEFPHDGSQRFLWREHEGLILGDKIIHASPEGKFKGFFTATDRMQPRITLIPLDEAFARGAFPRYVLIASSGDGWVRDVATDLYSVLRENSVKKQWWYPLYEKVLMLLVTLYLFFIVPRISTKSAVLMTTITVFILFLAQIVALATHKVEITSGLIVSWLILGHGFTALWKRNTNERLRLVERADSAVMMQADTYLEKGQYSEAEGLLKQCETRPEVLQKLYEIAGTFAEQRNYQSAVLTLQTISGRKKGYRDTEQKIQALEAMAATQSSVASAGAKIDTTMILDSPVVEKPVLGRYEVEEELGRGAMGVVYLGFDPKISRKVAIKTFNYKQFRPEQLGGLKDRFFREAEAAGRLNHPNIVSVFDVGEENDLAYIAMDFANGKPLNAFISEANLLPIFEVYRIICDVAQALEYAHSNHVVHRDIKPGNILYAPSPYQVKVTDFGIARLVDDSKTSTGEILGSPLYMSPEQLKGKKVTGASDIFSLGVTFYQLLTGALPFVGMNLPALTYEIIHGKHKGVRTVRKELPVSASRIINQCLQKAPEDRYSTAGELALVMKKAIKRDFPQAAKSAAYL